MEEKESSEHLTLRKLSPIPLPPAQPFRLMDLPDELWVRIGKMVIEDSAAIKVNRIITRENLILRKGETFGNRRLPAGYGYSFELTPPAILQTCAALRKELRAEYYRTKITISVERRPELGQYLRMVGPDARKMIQTTYSYFIAKKTQRTVGEPPAWPFNDWEMEMMWTSVRIRYRRPDLDRVEWQIKFL